MWTKSWRICGSGFGSGFDRTAARLERPIGQIKRHQASNSDGGHRHRVWLTWAAADLRRPRKTLRFWRQHCRSKQRQAVSPIPGSNPTRPPPRSAQQLDRAPDIGQVADVRASLNYARKSGSQELRPRCQFLTRFPLFSRFSMMAASVAPARFTPCNTML